MLTDNVTENNLVLGNGRIVLSPEAAKWLAEELKKNV
ncbi:hypothetical protein [Alkalihalobacillus sp. TS-13]|nr:hypothetical protein [Alkalihalobacillus sp. TS-13]